jgi:hypothetical protein
VCVDAIPRVNAEFAGVRSVPSTRCCGNSSGCVLASSSRALGIHLSGALVSVSEQGNADRDCFAWVCRDVKRA